LGAVIGSFMHANRSIPFVLAPENPIFCGDGGIRADKGLKDMRAICPAHLPGASVLVGSVYIAGLT
jgi:hypothetical protein